VQFESGMCQYYFRIIYFVGMFFYLYSCLRFSLDFLFLP
jgi:hypothetical protein